MSQKHDWSILHLCKDGVRKCDGGKQPNSSMPEKYLADDSLLTRCEVCYADRPKPKKVSQAKPIGDARKSLYLIDLWNKKRK